jgi:hypothetical protein
MDTNFSSNENKSLIWNLVFENGGFNDIPESRIDNIKLMLDNKVLEIINNNYNSTKSTIDLNKILLKSFYEDLKIYKLNENKTISAKKEENVNEFNKKLENYKNDMTDLLHAKIPETPNFEDSINSNLNDVSQSYDNLLKMREQQENQIYKSQQSKPIEIKVNNIENINENTNSKTSFLDLSTELFKIDENLSSSPEQNNSHINLSNVKKISPSIGKTNDNPILTRRNSIDSNDSNDSIISINIDSIEYLDCNENNTIIYINKNLQQIKRFEKISTDKKYLDQRSDNNFNIHNKLNIVINKIDELFKKYDALESQIKTLTKEID